MPRGTEAILAAQHAMGHELVVFTREPRGENDFEISVPFRHVVIGDVGIRDASSPERMEKLRAVLTAAQRDVTRGHISKEFIDTYIDRIFVTPLGENTARIDIRIFTGESTKKYLQKLKGRTCQIITDVSDESENRVNKGADEGSGRMGHMFKKMIEAYENGLK